MAWEPDSEEIRLRKQGDEIAKIRQNQYLATGINTGDINNIGTNSGANGYSFPTVGDIIQTTNNVFTTIGSVPFILASFIKLLPSLSGEPTPDCATVHFVNGGGRFGAGTIGQRLKIKPDAGKTVCLIGNPTSNPSTDGNLILEADVTINDKQIVTLRYQEDVLFSDGVGGWVLENSSIGGSSSGTVNGLKSPCRVASTGNNIAHPLWNTTIDGVVLTAGQRFLVKDQTTSQDNGIYVHSGSGITPSTRASDFADSSTQTGSLLVTVQEGTVNADTLWQLTTDDVITVGTTPLSFTQFTGGGSDNLGNHTATQTLKMKDFAIFLDTAETQSIIALATANNYIVPIGGAHDFFVNSLVTPKFGITETSIESNVQLDMNGNNIFSSVDPSVNQFRIVFDGHLDSDTFISNSTTVDRINVVSNGVNILAFRPTDVLMGIKLDMNTFDIQTVGNIDFGTGSPTSGRIRIPNTASIKWESVAPTGNYGELLYDVDEKFFWAVPSTGAFGFWHGGFNTINIDSTGIDMLFNNISNARLGTNLDARNFNITSTSTPTGVDQFRIVFDGNDDSDTFISNSTTTDRILFTSNGTAVIQIDPTELLVESTYKINMNTADITTVGNIDFGAGSPTSGRVRIPNSASIKWESVAPAGNYGELMFDVDEKFFWSVPTGGAFGFWEGGLLIMEVNANGIDMQLNNIDNVRNIEVNSNTTTAGFRDIGFTADPTSPLEGEMYYNTTTNTYKFYNGSIWVSMSSSGATSFIGFTGDADLDMNNFNIKSLIAPTAGDQFRIIFDAHDDSDTYIANTTTADRINVVSNGVNTLAFRPTDVLMGIKLDMNTFDIETIGNISFGTGSSTSGRIRLPNTASIKWASSPAGTDGEISYDVDENFFFATNATGKFGFWNDGFNTLNIISDGIDMLFNRITNTRSIEVNSATGEAGFRDVGFTADPSTPLAGEMYYNTTTNQMKFYNGSTWVAMDGGGATSFADNTFDVHDDATPSKVLQFSLAGLTAGTNFINVLTTSGVRTWSLPDITGTFIMNAGSQTFTGIKTFEYGNILLKESAGSNTGALVPASLATDKTWTFPDITGTVALLEGTQTFSGTKTFSGTFAVTASSASITSGTITLGDSSSDNLGLVAQINTNIIPDANSTYDLGSSSLRWDDIFANTIGFDSNHFIVMTSATVRVVTNGTGDKFEIHDGSSVRIEYDWSTDDFSPLDNVASLGKSGRRWVDVWAVNGTIQTSFTPFKTGITDVDTSHCLDVCNALKPIKYKWRPEHLKGMKEDKKKKELEKTHMGFSADALKTMCPDSVAGDDGVYQGSIMGHMLGAIQELTKQVNELKKKNV